MGIKSFDFLYPKMPKSAVDRSLNMKMRTWLVYGRRHPTEENPQPEIICTKVYGANEVFAKSQFWKINREQHKLKRAAGEIVRVREVHEKNTKTVKPYGIYFHYRDRTGFRNAFKEFRSTSLNNAMTQLCNEMAGRQKIHRESIQVIKTVVMGTKDIRTRDPRVGRFSNSCGVQFPIWAQRVRHGDASYNSKITCARPVTFRTKTNATN